MTTEAQQKDRRETDSRLTKIETILETEMKFIRKELGQLNKAIFIGNGSPSIIQKQTAQSVVIKDHTEEIKELKATSQRVFWSVGSILLTLLLFLGNQAFDRIFTP